MTDSDRRPRIVVRMNAVIEAIEPGFEVFGGKFQWYAFLKGRCGFTIDDYDLRPIGCPPVPQDFEGEGLSLNSILNFGLAIARADAFSSFIRNYVEDLNKKLNDHKLFRAIVSPTLFRDREGIQFGEEYPCASDAAWEDYVYTGKARSALRLDGKGRATLSLKIDRPFVVSWLRTLELSVNAGRRVEIGSRFHLERSEDADLDGTLRRVVAGEATILGGAFAMRGFSIGSPSSIPPENDRR